MGMGMGERGGGRGLGWREGWGRSGIGTYVAGGEFLLCCDDLASTLSGVQGVFTADYGLALGGATAGFATDLGDGFPVVHVVLLLG